MPDKNTDIVLDLGQWTVKDFDAFLEATNDNHLTIAATYLSQVIVSWPFAGNPNDPDAVAALKLHQYRALLKQVNVAMTALFAEGE